MTTVSDRLYHLGGAPVGLLDALCPSKVRMLAKPSTASTSYANYKHWSKRWPKENFHTTIYDAYTATTSLMNEVILVTPDSHMWYGTDATTVGALTWANSLTHLVGMAPHSKGGGMRSRFGHSGSAMANFLTVSGSSNLFSNLYWMHGSATGGASDVTCLTVSGHRNRFHNCNFAGPMDQTQASSANYAGVAITGQMNHFKDCTFGANNNVHREGANTMLHFSSTASMNVFEDCLFLSRSYATTPYFINSTYTTQLARWIGVFLNCQFINLPIVFNTNLIADAVAIAGATSTVNQLYFDSRTSFCGVSNVAPNTKGGLCFVGSSGASGDATADSDDKHAGIAQITVET